MNPDTPKPWPIEPTAPKYADYPKKLVRIGTRASSQSSQTQAQGTIQVEEVDHEHQATSVAEMTSDGRAAYQLAWHEYVFKAKDYKEHIANKEKLIAWIISTVSATYRKTCCTEGDSLDKWYQGFQKIGSAYEDNRIPDAREKYQLAIKPLSKLPKDFGSWLTRWETAIAEGQDLNIAETQTAQYWAPDLTKALRSVLSIWASSFDLINKKDIKENKLDFREVAADLRRQWATLQPKGSSIAKGAFPTYGLETAGSDKEEDSQQKKTPAKKGKGSGKGKRSRTDAEGGGSCKACLGAHTLPNCFYIFKEKAPEDWKPNPGIRRLVNDRIKDDILAEEIKRLQKGKDISTDQDS
jgi:hypothetical protein